MDLTRRDFIKKAASVGALTCLGDIVNANTAVSEEEKSQVFMVRDCPTPDGERRHIGLDALLGLLATRGMKLYQTDTDHPWGGPAGIIERDDVILIKVNCQWKCRGTTNTDVLQGLIHRILQHPDGFGGEIVIFENGQGQGSFDGNPRAWGSYSTWPTIDNGIYVNAEEEDALTVDYLVNTVFDGFPVSSYLLDTIRSHFITASEHLQDGYRVISDVSYPCFTSEGGYRIELREGIWNGDGYSTNLKLINMPVLKTHDGTGITGALKHTFGILSMADGHRGIRHYAQSGTQCGKMWSLVRIPDLNILDCIWVSHESLSGYPPETTRRTNILLGGIDPVALDYYGSKNVLSPVGGDRAHMHDPDSFQGLIGHLTGARDFINANGGIQGKPVHMADSSIEVVSTSAPGCVIYDLADMNEDCRVDLADGILSLQATTGMAPPLKWHEYADVNGDGRIGIQELIYILQKVSGMR